MSHYDQLAAAFEREWEDGEDRADLQGADLNNDTTRYWWVNDAQGREIIRWECRRFPGCDTLIITTKVELRTDLRGRGLGRYFRELRHRAYRRAGFVGELATVRADNAPQNRLMVGSTCMGEFRSDFGGTYKVWLTTLMPHRDTEGRLTPPRWVGEDLFVEQAPATQVHTGLLGEQTITRHLRPLDPPAPRVAAPMGLDLGGPPVTATPRPPKIWSHRNGK